MPPEDPNLADTRDERTVASDAESLIGHLKHAAASAPPSAAPVSEQLPDVPGYEIIGELGRGGMGVVYLARHVPLNRIVALKMLLAAHATAGEVVRFRDEAASVAAVEHANVVQVYELSPEGCPRPYFAMEYAAGGSLANFLKANGRLSPRTAAELVAAIADGLQAAHDAGLVHRDVKPANVLLAVGSG